MSESRAVLLEGTSAELSGRSAAAVRPRIIFSVLSRQNIHRYTDPDKLQRFTIKMGWVTFVVGIVQGITSFAILRRHSAFLYRIALRFTLFSITSVAWKLKGKINAFPVLKCIAYTAILIVLLLSGTRAQFFG